LRLEIPCPSNSYTFELVLMTNHEKMIFKEFGSRERDIWT
jgi:hypothetical protein